ncbi:MAG: PHB depolymerase family esterase [Lacunisphaera sp.]
MILPPNQISPALRRYFGAALLITIFVGAFSPAKAATAADFLSAKLPKTGVEPNDLPYRYLVPAGYNAGHDYPLIVFLHGSGERGSDNTAQLNNNANGALQLVSGANQSATPCFMIAPQASVNEGWNANTLGQVIRAIQVLETNYSIDLNRIYVTGLSMGGGGTWDIITRFPNFFAAAVPMSGWGAGSYEKITALPIWAFHSANDGTVAVSGSDNAVGAVRQLGGRVIYTRYATGGHGIWPTAYANPYLFPWLMAQHRNQAMAGVPIVSVVSPTPHVLSPPAVSTLTISGTASVPGGASQISWTMTPWVGSAGVDTSTYSLASGTDSWLVSNAAVAGNSSLFLAIATGSSWANGTGSATGGGVTTLNDYLWTVPTGANVTPPAIAIAAPNGSGALTTSVVSLNLAGTASASTGKTVKGITWRSDRGGRGIGLGTTTWTINSIDLQTGDNVITVSVRDSSSITTNTTFTVHSTGTGVVIAPSHAVITITVL